MVAETLKKLNLSGMISPADLQAKINAGLDRLNDLKHDDGGWGWWKEDNSRVFMTAYVVSGLAQAKAAGYAKAGGESRRGSGLPAKATGAASANDSGPARVCAVSLSEAGAKNLGSSVETLWSRRNDLSAEGLALTGMVMLRTGDSRSAQVAQILESKVKREGSLASWPSMHNPAARHQR